MTISVQKKVLAVVKHFCGFSLVGIVMTLLSAILIFIFNYFFQWNPYISYSISYILTLLLSYYLNAKLVFQKKLQSRALIFYCLIYSSGLLIGIGLLHFFLWSFPQMSDTLLSYFAIPVTTIWNFVGVRMLMVCRKGDE